jgi:hypothetical protein
MTLERIIDSTMTNDAAELVGELVSWKWYCRIDGAEGVHYTTQERDAAALQHRDHDCQTRDLPHAMWAEAGQLVHVWKY